MSDETETAQSAPKRKSAKNPQPLPLPVAVPKWPFFLSDIIFIGLGYWISTLIQSEPESWQIISIVVCAVFGTGFAVAPFYFEYRAEAKAVEIAQLTSVAKEVNKMENVAAQISEATENWEAVQEQSTQTAKLAEEIAQGIAASVKEHDAFMAQAGHLVVCGDAGDGLGDSIYEAVIYVRGEVGSLGADCVEKEMTDVHVENLAALLKRGNIEADAKAFRRYGSARRLYNFDVDNVGQY